MRRPGRGNRRFVVAARARRPLYITGTIAETNAWRVTLGAGPAIFMTDARRLLEVPAQSEGLLGTGGIPAGCSDCVLIIGQSNGTLTVAPDLVPHGAVVVNMAVFGSAASTWDPETGANYTAMLNTVRTLRVREVWWNQGEADSTSIANANGYKAKVEKTFTALRARFGAALRIRLCLLTTASALTYAATVRAAQQAIVDEQEHTHGFDLSAYELVDGLHFGPTSLPSTGPQYVAIGQALGAEFVAANGGGA
jgi:hypothetical protein